MSSEAKNTNSAFAVDGKLGPDPDKCQCCSITNNSPLSWWLLDLGKRYPLKSIIIYGRNKGDFITAHIQFVRTCASKIQYSFICHTLKVNTCFVYLLQNFNVYVKRYMHFGYIGSNQCYAILSKKCQ
jgi:hypothetical protein